MKSEGLHHLGGPASRFLLPWSPQPIGRPKGFWAIVGFQCQRVQNGKKKSSHGLTSSSFELQDNCFCIFELFCCLCWLDLAWSGSLKRSAQAVIVSLAIHILILWTGPPGLSIGILGGGGRWMQGLCRWGCLRAGATVHKGRHNVLRRLKMG